jgi:hypothetical protein
VVEIDMARSVNSFDAVLATAHLKARRDVKLTLEIEVESACWARVGRRQADESCTRIGSPPTSQLAQMRDLNIC